MQTLVIIYHIFSPPVNFNIEQCHSVHDIGAKLGFINYESHCLQVYEFAVSSATNVQGTGIIKL